ncbi:venom acid phosphatase Acph-1-like [Polistes fuscatus]|uniref:venom acid phosphatase Acph-1-like n=1 Tax=Polistes fuscatus TaxID=30207 RepID=UPI001CA911A4|nr:venom acid phosphatase Acph-1-like [Polistes fuscatus]
MKRLVIFLTLLTFALGIDELKLLQIIFMNDQYVSYEDVILNNVKLSSNIFSYNYNINSMTKDLPKVSKLNMYNLGTYLRERYDKFLGNVYSNKIMKIRTTEFPLSQISAELVNAALWPPSELQKWNDDLNWQPIPFEYIKMENDTLLLGTYCPRFQIEELKAEEYMEKIISHHTPLFNYLSNHTGMKITKPSDVEFLYNVLKTRDAYNLSIPFWATDTFPDGEIYNVTLLQYDLLTMTNVQKQLSGGTFLKEIILNAIKYSHGIMTNDRKIMMYSGDIKNIIGILKAMNLWSPHIPSEASSLIFELYFNNVTSQYGMMINYYTGIHEENIILTLPECSEICPLNEFSKILLDSIPIDEDSLCRYTTDDLLYTNITSKTSAVYNRISD